MDWKKWDDEKPAGGMKIVLLTDDGCSTSAGLAYEPLNGEVGVLDAEDGIDLPAPYLRGALWAPIPETYGLAFMEAD